MLGGWVSPWSKRDEVPILACSSHNSQGYGFTSSSGRPLSPLSVSQFQNFYILRLLKWPIVLKMHVWYSFIHTISPPKLAWVEAIRLRTVSDGGSVIRCIYSLYVCKYTVRKVDSEKYFLLGWRLSRVCWPLLIIETSWDKREQKPLFPVDPERKDRERMGRSTVWYIHVEQKDFPGV